MVTRGVNTGWRHCGSDRPLSWALSSQAWHERLYWYALRIDIFEDDLVCPWPPLMLTTGFDFLLDFRFLGICFQVSWSSSKYSMTTHQSMLQASKSCFTPQGSAGSRGLQLPTEVLVKAGEHNRSSGINQDSLQRWTAASHSYLWCWISPGL